MDTLELPAYANEPRIDACPDVHADCSPVTFTDRDRTTGCKASTIYPPGLGCMDGRTIHPRSVQESMGRSSPSAKTVTSVLTVPAHLSPRDTSELSSIWKSKDTRVENMKSIRIVGEVVRLLKMSLKLVSSPLEYCVEVEHDVRRIFTVVAPPPTPVEE